MASQDADDISDRETDGDSELIDEDDSCLVNEDMTFRDIIINVRDRKLQNLVVEFITSLILKHEQEFYLLVQNKLNMRFDILNTTNKTIIEMIIAINNKYYNDLYLSIQNNKENSCKNLILDMQKFVEYDTYILLFKLLHLTLEAHIDIYRENLVTNNLDLYKKTTLSEINLFLQSANIIDAFRNQPDDCIKIPAIAAGQLPFNIVIHKNVES